MSYDAGFAEVYDDVFHQTSEAERVVDRLESLLHQSGSRVLEYGVGTGRIALRLARRGHTVLGVDASARMLAHLADKLTPEDDLEYVLGDMSNFQPREGGYDLVYNILGSISCLFDEPERVRTLESSVKAVRQGGRVVIESYNPTLILKAFDSLDRSEFGEEADYPTGHLSSVVRRPSSGELAIEHTFTREGSRISFPESVWLIDPQWLVDKMTTLGMKLQSFDGSWSGEEFSAEYSPMYILVFEK